MGLFPPRAVLRRVAVTGAGEGGEERLAAVLEDSEREGRLLVQWGVSRRAAPEPDWGDRGSAEVPQGRWERR